MSMEGLSSVAHSEGWGAPPRLILNLEVLFLAFGGGIEERSCPTVREGDPFGNLGPTFSTSPCWMSFTISFKSSSLSPGLPTS